MKRFTSESKVLVIVLIIFILTLLCGCKSDAVHLSYVQERYPNSVVFPIPDEPGKFVVIDSNHTVIYLTTIAWPNGEIDVTNAIKIK